MIGMSMDLDTAWGWLVYKSLVTWYSHCSKGEQVNCCIAGYVPWRLASKTSLPTLQEVQGVERWQIYLHDGRKTPSHHSTAGFRNGNTSDFLQDTVREDWGDCGLGGQYSLGRRSLVIVCGILFPSSVLRAHSWCQCVHTAQLRSSGV